MDTISIRYGEGVTLPLETGDTTAVSADIFIGKPGELYVFTKNITLVDGNGTFELTAEDTELPLDTYFYQINVNYATGGPDKFPAPKKDCDTCESDFPKFIVNESLDQVEVS